MKKSYLFTLFSSFFIGTLSVNAQTILDEDFETSNVDSENPITRPVAKGGGWTTIDSYTGSKAAYKWANYYNEKGTIGGTHVAQCDGAMYADDGADGTGPREEMLLTPELNLDNTYQLSFDWKVSPMASSKNSLYDFQIRVIVNDDVKNAETIFSIQNKEDLKESGVNEYPISSWDAHTSKIDLSEWRGKKVKIAFVYKMLTTNANVVFLDNVSVKQFTPPTGPVAQINTTSYNYGNVYIGEKFYSEAFRLTNTGKDGLKINSVDMPQGVAMNIDYTKVNLDKSGVAQFKLSYTAGLTTSASPNVVLHTNGGDVTIGLKANKMMAPDGLTEETFENYFPPVGWKNEGWTRAADALEGDYSAYATGALADQYLTSPRLDLTEGGKVQFTYNNQFDSEDGSSYQSNDITLDLSTDGGKTWESKWTFDYEKMSYGETVTVDLGKGTDNSYVRWHNTAVGSDDDGAYEFSSFYLDRVFLPKYYGAESAPDTTSFVSPKDGADNVYPENVKLEWTPVLFAKGYNLYVGTSEGVYNVIDGINVKDGVSYTLPKADYETTYYWKVVPYNDNGTAADAKEWHFTTQKDGSTSAYPYTEDFSKCGKNLPAGWLSESTSEYGASRNWSVLDLKGNPAPCLYNMWLNKGETSTVTTSEFKLPANKSMSISFDWVDQHPTNAIVDHLGTAQKHNVSNAPTKVGFEIGVDGQWTELSAISQNLDEDETPIYWINEKIDLSKYAGKTVKFRWIHYSYSGSDHGCGLDNIVIEEKVGDKAIFNKSGWNAGKVNYGKAVNSGDILTLINKGENTLKVKSVSFATDNFTSSLAPGDEIAPRAGKLFSVQFNAKQASADVKDNMTVEFESGYTMTLPVEGTALASDILYYSFEDNALEYDWTKDFNLIDVDRAATEPFNCYGTEFPSNKGVFAFAVAYERPEHNNVAPVSGDAFLIPGNPQAEDEKGDNWIVSKKLKATANSTFDFYARNWESNQSVLPGAMHKVEVLVSETSNSDRSTFTTVLKQQEIPFLDGTEWKHYTVSLSDYAGRDIYVAVRDYTEQWALAAFYDDFTFSHFEGLATGISSVNAGIDADAAVTVFNLSGVKVAEGTGVGTLEHLEKGVYVVKVKTAEGEKTMKVARK